MSLATTRPGEESWHGGRLDEAALLASRMVFEDGQGLIFTLSRKIRRDGLATLEILQADLTPLKATRHQETSGLPPCLLE
jgi:hypothetical protein